MAARGFSIGQIVAQVSALVRENLPFLAIVAAIVAGAEVLIGLVAPKAAPAVALVVSIFVQYKVIERLLQDQMHMDAGRRRYGAIFVAALVGGLGILLGFALFVVPGLILVAGWTASTPYIVVDKMGGVAALGASWRATRGSRMALAAIYVVGGVAFLAALALVGGFSGFASLNGVRTSQVQMAGTLPEAAAVVSNIVGAVITVALWVLGAAVYRLAESGRNSLQQVFA